MADGKCPFWKKVLAGVACLCVFIIAILIHLLSAGGSVNRSRPPAWLYGIALVTCPAIWKAITGENWNK